MVFIRYLGYHHTDALLLKSDDSSLGSIFLPAFLNSKTFLHPATVPFPLIRSAFQLFHLHYEAEEVFLSVWTKVSSTSLVDTELTITATTQSLNSITVVGLTDALSDRFP